MNGQAFWNFIKSDYLKLVLLSVLAFYIAFIPHINYPYPVHVDEWVHLAFSQAMMKSGSVTFINPFNGRDILNLGSNLESGFHLFLGVFQQISGVSWLVIFRYFPSLLLMLTALSVYTMARKEGFGWEAAFFTCLIPTTVGILGPAFLVPVATGLIFVPLSLFVAFNFKNAGAYVVLFVFTSFLLSIHAPSAIVSVLVLAPYVIMNLRRNFRHSLGTTLALAVPFLAPFPWIFKLLLPTAKSMLTPQPLSFFVQFPALIKTYGYLPTALCLVGAFLLAVKGGIRKYALILGLLTLLIVLVIFFNFGYGVSIVYERGLVFAMLMVSIVAGAGLAGVKSLALSRFNSQRVVSLLTGNLGKLLCLILIILILAVAIPDRQRTTYYHTIDDQDYQAFVWIKENLTEQYQKAILDPWKATAFTAITGKAVYTRLHAYPTPDDEKAREFLEEGCIDTDFLKNNGISMVYNLGICRNPDLVEVRKNVYLLKK